MLCSCPAFLNAVRFPGKPAIVWSGRSINWSAVNNYVHSTSRYLKEITVKPGHRVILVMENCAACYIVLLALWRIRAVACPVSAASCKEDISLVHRLINPDFVISNRKVKGAWAKGIRSADVEQVVAYGYNDAFLAGNAALDPKIDSDDEAVVVLRCGSDGLEVKPLTHATLNETEHMLSSFMSVLSTGEKLIL